MDRWGLGRRELLRRGSAVAGGATLASLAGCSAVEGVFSGGSGRGIYDWLAAPSEFGTEQYFLVRTDFAALRNNEEHLGNETRTNYEGLLDPFARIGLGFDSVDETLFLNGPAGSGVLRGEFESDAVRAEIADGDIPFRTTEHRGYTVYHAEDAVVAYAVGDRVVRARPVRGGSALDGAKLLLETKFGAKPLYQEESDALGRLLGLLDSPTGVLAGERRPEGPARPELGRFEGSTAFASTTTIEGERSTRRWIYLFESSEAVNRTAVETWVEARSNDLFANVSELSVERRSRAVVVEGTVPTADL